MLVSLYEEPEKPEDALEYLSTFLRGTVDLDGDALKLENEEMKRRIEELELKVEELSKREVFQKIALYSCGWNGIECDG